MSILTEASVIEQKTRELCEAILAENDYLASQQRIEAFMADEKARAQYDGVVSKGQSLQEKQHHGQPLEQSEIAEFEAAREALLNNAVARGFMDAQEHLHELQQSIVKQVKKTLELGRLPTAEDLNEGGSCGSGCGCH